MKKALFVLSTALSGLSLAAAQAVAQQGQVNFLAITNLIISIQNIVARLVPLAIGLAVLAFFWFLIQFIWKSGDPNGRADSLRGMGYSVLALFVMVSIWGIIGFLGSIVGVGQGGTAPTPSVPVPTS
jgi:hypothetical protein